LKSALLDQHVVAGLGNLCADEVLWWAGLDPRRTVDSLTVPEIDRLASAIRRRLPIMLARGGSTTGVLSPAVRAACPPCQRDGAPLERLAIGGRTTVWCPRHQR
jgi:formamidopyrimidine-DNA glycosylase